jgi:hypothetical protein
MVSESKIKSNGRCQCVFSTERTYFSAGVRNTWRFMLTLCSNPLALPPGNSSNRNELDPAEFIGLAITS